MESGHVVPARGQPYSYPSSSQTVVADGTARTSARISEIVPRHLSVLVVAAFRGDPPQHCLMIALAKLATSDTASGAGSGLLAPRLARGDIRIGELKFEQVGQCLQELSGRMSEGFGLERVGSVWGSGYRNRQA